MGKWRWAGPPFQHLLKLDDALLGWLVPSSLAHSGSDRNSIEPIERTERGRDLVVPAPPLSPAIPDACSCQSFLFCERRHLHFHLHWAHPWHLQIETGKAVGSKSRYRVMMMPGETLKTVPKVQFLKYLSNGRWVGFFFWFCVCLFVLNNCFTSPGH